MTDTRNMQRDFLELLDPEQPQFAREWLAEIRRTRPRDRDINSPGWPGVDNWLAEVQEWDSSDRDAPAAKTIKRIVIDPLDWFIDESFKKSGRQFLKDQIMEFRIYADDICYRLTHQQSIIFEMIEALETKWVAFQTYIGWDNWVRLEKTGSSLKRTEQRLAAIEPLAEHGEKFKTAQLTKAKRPRSRQKVDGEAFSIKSIIDILAKRKDALGERVPSMDLWPELFSELDRRELDPEEFADRITFTKNDSGDIGEIKKSSFKAMVSRARKNQS